MHADISYFKESERDAHRTWSMNATIYDDEANMYELKSSLQLSRSK